MDTGTPIGLLLALTYSVYVLGTNSGTDSLETISELAGSAVSAASGGDSLERITSINGSAVSASSYTDANETITSIPGSAVTANDDSSESLG